MRYVVNSEYDVGWVLITVRVADTVAGQQKGYGVQKNEILAEPIRCINQLITLFFVYNRS